MLISAQRGLRSALITAGLLMLGTGIASAEENANVGGSSGQHGSAEGGATANGHGSSPDIRSFGIDRHMPLPGLPGQGGGLLSDGTLTDMPGFGSAPAAPASAGGGGHPAARAPERVGLPQVRTLPVEVPRKDVVPAHTLAS